jgi:hypothetical protein
MRSRIASRFSVSRMPGLTTLMITESPSSVVARWIWAIEAEPVGMGSIQEYISPIGRWTSASMRRT